MIISEVTPGYLRMLPSVSGTEFGPKEPTTNFRTQYVLAPHPRTMATSLLVVPLSTPLFAALGLSVCFNLSICEHRNTASGGPATNCQICGQN